MDEIKGELLKDTIYVFTPKGQAIELPIGSTALDFAYSIHTEIGNHTVSAKANGNIIPLGQPLKNTQHRGSVSDLRECAGRCLSMQ